MPSLPGDQRRPEFRLKPGADCPVPTEAATILDYIAAKSGIGRGKSLSASATMQMLVSLGEPRQPSDPWYRQFVAAPAAVGRRPVQFRPFWSKA
jgi:hypothetical protein